MTSTVRCLSGSKSGMTMSSYAMVDSAILIRCYLLYFIIPLWLVAGLADYLLHRQTKIEDTSGIKESLLHAVQLGETGIAIAAGLLFEINALILLVMLVALVVHDATALWDTKYAIHRRYVGALEQHVHSFLELLPLMAVSFVIILHWPQFLALAGLGSESPRFDLQFKSTPLPVSYLVPLSIAVVSFAVLPYAEELWRCAKQDRARELVEQEQSVLRTSDGSLSDGLT